MIMSRELRVDIVIKLKADTKNSRFKTPTYFHTLNSTQLKRRDESIKVIERSQQSLFIFHLLLNISTAHHSIVKLNLDVVII